MVRYGFAWVAGCDCVGRYKDRNARELRRNGLMCTRTRKEMWQGRDAMW